MAWTGLRNLAAIAVLAPLALVAAPIGPATAVDAGDPVIHEDFSGALAGWVGDGAASDGWATVYDPASPSPEKTVFANEDGQATEHAAHWLAAGLGATFQLSVTAESTPTEVETWVGVALRYDPGTGRYIAVRFEVGGERVEVRRYPGAELIAATTRSTALGGEGCTWLYQPNYPPGEYFDIRVLQDPSGLLWVYDHDDPLLNVPLAEDERDGGHAGVYYSGGPSRFEDLMIQGPDLQTPWAASVAVDATTLGTNLEDGVFGAMALWHAAANGIDPTAATLDDRRDNLARLQETFPMMASMGIKTLRFPGGLLSNDYRWKDHIGNFHEGTGISELTLDDFLLMAESLGARPIITVNASDPPFGLGTVDGAREAADWVEYMTVPDDGSNPDPDGLAPDDPDNIDWAHLRTLQGHREPYDVAGFEVGNELRGPPYLNSIYPASAYAERFVEFSGAMKAVNPAILVGAVGKDNPLSSTYKPWYEDVSARL
ncbi:MAG: hypothetical protein KC466_11320, partial [Myxococcales bacterium]|nr:hypothetical protein [Myxococcales bacterium]